jgi:hypothetical protein
MTRVGTRIQSEKLTNNPFYANKTYNREQVISQSKFRSRLSTKRPHVDPKTSLILHAGIRLIAVNTMILGT